MNPYSSKVKLKFYQNRNRSNLFVQRKTKRRQLEMLDGNRKTIDVKNEMKNVKVQKLLTVKKKMREKKI